MRSFPSVEHRANLALATAYSSLEFEHIRRGVAPQEMEDKWEITFEDPWLYFHRSWTGICVYGLRFERSAAGATVGESWVNRDEAQYRSTSIEYDQAMVRFLVDALVLGKQAVFPDPPGETLTGLTKALDEHSAVGRVASVASHEFVTNEYGRGGIGCCFDIVRIKAVTPNELSLKLTRLALAGRCVFIRRTTIHFGAAGVYHSSMRSIRAGVALLAVGAMLAGLPARVFGNGVALRLHGSVEPVRSHPVVVPRLNGSGRGTGPGTLVIVHLVKPGTRVRRGDLLIEFDRQTQIKAAHDRQAEYRLWRHTGAMQV